MAGEVCYVRILATFRACYSRFVLHRSLTALILALLLSAGFWQSAPARTADSATRPYLVLIVMDGFRSDYQTLAPMHHLRALLARGRVYENAWVGQLEAETPASHATIATGVYPRKHGVIGFGWRDPASGRFTYMPTDLGAIEAGDLSHVIEQGGVPTISDVIHARNRHDLTVSVSGEKLWASAPMGTGADYVLYGRGVKVPKGENSFRPLAVGPNMPPKSSGYQSVSKPDGAFNTQDDFAARLAIKLVAATRPRALLLNLPATDIAGHYYGGMSDPRDMTPIIRGADSAIGKVEGEYQKLGILKNTIFVVTADHGMVAGRHRVPIHSIYGAVAKAGFPQLDQELRNSIGSIWLQDPAHAPVLASTLAADHFSGVDAVFYKVPQGDSWTFQAVPSTARSLPPAVLRADLDLANTEASMSGSDILLSYREDTTGMPLGKSFRGMHGGFSWGSQHIPLVIAGPGVRPGQSYFPAQLVDLAPTIERLMGLQVPAGVDGVVLADAMKGATVAQTQAQSAVQGRRLADIRAIRAYSASQTR